MNSDNLLDMPSPRRVRILLLTIVLSLLALIGWASWAQIDQVTRASAIFIAAGRTQVIQSPDLGVVTRLHVKEGDSVEQGQLLVTLEKERALAAVADSRGKAAALRASIARLESELFDKPLNFGDVATEFPEYAQNQQLLYQRRKTALNEDVQALVSILRITQSELSINKQLLSTGDVSQAEVLRLEKSAADINAQIISRKNKFYQEAQAELTKAKEELNTIEEQLRERAQVLEQTELRAPSKGVVNNIRVTTLGAVVRAGDVVLELLPTGGDLIAEAKITPADIAFVKVGQRALVKIDAFDSTVFGGLIGEVVYISPDVLREEVKDEVLMFYRVHVLVKESEYAAKRSSEIVLRPGLTAQVEIKALERSVLSYLVKPIVKTLDLSMGER